MSTDAGRGSLSMEGGSVGGGVSKGQCVDRNGRCSAGKILWSRLALGGFWDGFEG